VLCVVFFIRIFFLLVWVGFYLSGWMVYLRPRCSVSPVSSSASFPGRNYLGPSSRDGVACAPVSPYGPARSILIAPLGPERATFVFIFRFSNFAPREYSEEYREGQHNGRVIKKNKS